MVPTETDLGPVAVIGAGVTGASWAAAFAGYGIPVHLCDHDREELNAGVQKARRFLSFMIEHRLVQSDLARRGRESLATHTSISDAVADATFVQEAVSERYEVKRSVFAEVDAQTPPSTLISTSTSGLSISQIQEVCSIPQRCIAGHPYNPPHIMPLVEIAPGRHTTEETIRLADQVYRSIGKLTVILEEDVPGYLANRMSAALWREAVDLVLDGVASVEDVDRAIRYGPGLRWAIMGPHMLYHLGGGRGGIRSHIEHLGFAKERIWRDLATWQSLPEEAGEILEQGLPELRAIEKMMDTRDRKLASVLQALRPDSDDPSF